MSDHQDRIERLPAMASYEELRGITTSIARLETKLENLTALLAAHTLLEQRVRALEIQQAASKQTTVHQSATWLWVRDSAFAIGLAIVGAKQWWG